MRTRILTVSAKDERKRKGKMNHKKKERKVTKTSCSPCCFAPGERRAQGTLERMKVIGWRSVELFIFFFLRQGPLPAASEQVSRWECDIDGGFFGTTARCRVLDILKSRGKERVNEREEGRKKPFLFLFFSSTLHSPLSLSLSHCTLISPMEPMERKLMSSAAAGSIKAVTLLKDNPDLNVNCKDSGGRSRPHLASEWGNLGGCPPASRTP